MREKQTERQTNKQTDIQRGRERAWERQRRWVHFEQRFLPTAKWQHL